MGKLNQVLAVEKGIKQKSHDVHTESYQAAQKPALFNGLAKTYKPKNEDGERFPPENVRVQVSANDLLARVEKELAAYYDVVLTKDLANCQAKADIVVGGKVIAKEVPATHLLFLEKHLGELKTFVSALPVLDPAEAWHLDEAVALYKSEPTSVAKSKKIQKGLVLHPPTKEHPAQTQLITEDEVVGYWEQVKHSGALPPSKKAAIVDRIEALLAAVQKAREAANGVEAPEQRIGKAIFDHIFDR